MKKIIVVILLFGFLGFVPLANAEIPPYPDVSKLELLPYEYTGVKYTDRVVFLGNSPYRWVAHDFLEGTDFINPSYGAGGYWEITEGAGCGYFKCISLWNSSRMRYWDENSNTWMDSISTLDILSTSEQWKDSIIWSTQTLLFAPYVTYPYCIPLPPNDETYCNGDVVNGVIEPLLIPPQEAKLEISPAQYDFGERDTEQCSLPMEFKLSNVGGKNIVVSNMALSNQEDFILILDGGEDPCNSSNPTLAPGDFCTVGIIFCPTIGGSLAGNLTVTSNDPVNPSLVVALNGEGNDEFKLAFPLKLRCGDDDCNPYTMPVTAVFDHSANAPYAGNRRVVAFTGEIGERITFPGTTCYRKSDRTAFGEGFNYVGSMEAGGKYYFCYDGHPGIDLRVSVKKPVYAAADGIAHLPRSFPGVSNARAYNTLEIDHRNGYKSYYLHLYSIQVKEGDKVKKGDPVGLSGKTAPLKKPVGPHLHFEVQKEVNGKWIPVDPYGWEGNSEDPYRRTTNINLWE